MATAMHFDPLVSIENLSLGCHLSDPANSLLLNEISLSLSEQEILVLTGSSGSGKTSLLMAMMGFLKPGIYCQTGSVSLAGNTILQPDRTPPAGFRGKTVALVPQNAGIALTPTLRVYDQIDESLKLHTSRNKSQRRKRIYELLSLMKINNPEQSGQKYPHEFSGGQQQRIAIAMTMAPDPKLLLLDEPTSGLDQLNIRELLTLLSDIRWNCQTSMVMVSHDLNVIRAIADRVAILNKGKLEACGKVAMVFSPETKGTAARLIQAFQPEVPPVVPQKNRAGILKCENMALDYKEAGITSLFSRATSILKNINLEISAGEMVVITGHSGSGKSSILNCIAGLDSINAGNIWFNQQPLEKLPKRSLATKKEIQLIFQNSDLALNPAMTIEKILNSPLQLYFQLTRNEKKKRVAELLGRVHLPESYLSLKPAQLSGGERQRIAIARACAARPKLLLCDEVTASLDVVNRNGILTFLRELVTNDDCACLMVTHEQEVIRQIAQRIYVMAQGEIVCHLNRDEYLINRQKPAKQFATDQSAQPEIMGCVA